MWLCSVLQVADGSVRSKVKGMGNLFLSRWGLAFVMIITATAVVWLGRCKKVSWDFPPLVEALPSSLIIRGPQHPPWAQGHFIGVDMDLGSNTVRICEYSVIMNPLSSRVWNLRPILLDDLPIGEFDVKYWSEKRYRSLGRLVVGKSGDYHWSPAVE